MSRRYILTDEQEALYRRSVRTIAPSRVADEHWEGDWRDGEVFSNAQLHNLAVMGLDAGTVDRLDVFAAGQTGRVYITALFGLSYQEVVYFHRRLPCPIIGKSGDRLLVITPAGHQKLVYPNGELTRPKSRHPSLSQSPRAFLEEGWGR